MANTVLLVAAAAIIGYAIGRVHSLAVFHRSNK